MLLALLTVAVAAPPGPAWRFDARVIEGDVRVLPVIDQTVDLTHRRDTFIGAGLTPPQQELRQRRERQLTKVPGALALSIPGAVQREIGHAWGGSFVPGAWPVGQKRAVENALGDPTRLDDALAALGRRSSADGVLVTWVESWTATPLSAIALPGDIVTTEVGPVVVDHDVEPYAITARVGTALVAGDGEIVLRYVDTFDTVLDADGQHDAGRVLARSLAHELALVWPTDPALFDGGPGWQESYDRLSSGGVTAAP